VIYLFSAPRQIRSLHSAVGWIPEAIAEHALRHSSHRSCRSTAQATRSSWTSVKEMRVGMPKVTYIEYNGTAHLVVVPVGLSVMRGAVNNNVPGIDADCGGECACATCHVYVDPAWLDKTGTPVPGSQEASMLSFAAEAEFNSRLSCQIAMREELDGLVVRMPQGQH
jgi:2Fe-2S ferredoxin